MLLNFNPDCGFRVFVGRKRDNFWIVGSLPVQAAVINAAVNDIKEKKLARGKVNGRAGKPLKVTLQRSVVVSLLEACAVSFFLNGTADEIKAHPSCGFKFLPVQERKL
jgi:hypothetical protein